MLDTILKALEIHGPIGAVLLLFGVVGREHIKRDEAARKSVTERLAALETDRVTKHDLERVFDRIESVSAQMQENQNTLLQALSRRS